MTEDLKNTIAQKRKRKYTEREKQDVIDQLWLTYFNDTLYDKGLITETARNQMRNWINTRKPGKHRDDLAR